MFLVKDLKKCSVSFIALNLLLSGQLIDGTSYHPYYFGNSRAANYSIRVSMPQENFENERTARLAELKNFMARSCVDWRPHLNDVFHAQPEKMAPQEPITARSGGTNMPKNEIGGIYAKSYHGFWTMLKSCF